MIYLASRSPRRRALLDQLGVRFEVLDPDIDESGLAGETPDALVRRLAAAKAAAGRELLGRGGAHLVLGADTVVVLDDEVLGKPHDASHACELLLRLSGCCHRVLSGVALASADNTATRLSESRVCFRQLSRQECEAYASSGEPLDKAGGYGIQGRAAAFVSNLQGSYSGVVGLPLYETAELLTEAGIALFPRR
ncbi:MAG: Maf family protein [Gammaproteobacteria bacterium]|nr:MAG: Maf family protein [Gammaproteobacteria bacterium]